MPIHWSHPPTQETVQHRLAETPILTLTLTHHNALTAPGFVWVIGATATLMVLPILAFIGSYFLWILLLSLGTALASIWIALRHSWHRGKVSEVMEFHADKVTLRHITAKGNVQDWQANPYWVQPLIREKDGPVPNYLTLQGGDRLVELGAFLSADERPELAENLRQVLNALAASNPDAP